MITAFLSRLRPAPATDQAARIVARCFQSEDGKFVLDYLHRHILFRQTQPDISADELRFLEGQRQLVLSLCALAASSAYPSSTSLSRSN